MESGRGGAGGRRCGAQRRLGGGGVEREEEKERGRGEEGRDVADKWTPPPRGVRVSETG